MIIAIDVDNVLNNLCEAVLSVYNEDSGDSLSPFSIHSYYIDNYVKPTYRKTFKHYFCDKRVWKRIKLIKDCQQYVAALFREGHTILFVTSTGPENLKKKANWLQRNFPYINIRKSLFSCPVKQYMEGIDILIDDAAYNLVGAKYKGIILDYPWNQDFITDNKQFFRANNWGEIHRIITEIDKYKQEENNVYR